MIWKLLALVCIIVGICLAAFDAHLWFEPLVWFVLAIAFELLELAVPGVVVTHKSE